MPPNPLLWHNSAQVLSDLGQSAEADLCFVEALRIAADHASASHNAGGGRLFNLLFREDLDLQDLLQAHETWGQSQVDRLPPRPIPRTPIEGKLRVGFLSGDFRQHAMAMFVVPLLEKLDRTAFEVCCYANQTHSDGVSAAIRALPLTWRETANLTDQACGDLVWAERLDVLVDLNGHTDGQRMGVLSLRTAPCVATWLGSMTTTGHPGIHCRITHRWTDPSPESAAMHTETLAYLEGSQFTFRPAISAPAVQPNPALTRRQITFGSLNNVRKHSRIHQNTHLNRYHEIDIALDPYPSGGGATTCDALWMGVPLITLAGDRSVGRMGVSVLQSVGRPEWIAEDAEQYVRPAENLTADVAALNQTRLGLRDPMERSPLRDEVGFVSRFGGVFRQMADRRSVHSPGEGAW